MRPTQAFLLSDLPDGWSVAKVGEVAKRVTEKERVEPGKEYKMIGVKWYGEGTFHRETATGESLSATYLTPVIPQSFIYNRLFAWKQSFAVVPPEHAYHFVSNEFPQFSVDEDRLLPEFLYLFFMLDSTTRSVDAASVGSAAVSRNRFKEEYFLDFDIPLPPLAMQQAIVARWRQAQAEKQAAEERVEKIRAEIDERFFVDLGLRYQQQVDLPKAFAVNWEDLERWGLNFNQQRLTGEDLTRGKYPVCELGSILELVQYGTSEKANSEGKGAPIIRMNNIVDGLLDLSNLKRIVLLERERERLILREGDILFNRTNSKELVGKCGVFREIGEYVFASYLIRVRVDSQVALPEFIAHAINSRIGRRQIDAMSRQIIGQANINAEELRSLQIPIPPLEIQREIIAHIEAARAAITRERERAAQDAREAEAEIEAMIRGTRQMGASGTI